MKKNLILLLLYTLGTLHLCAQPAFSSINYTINDGLSQNTVNCIIQDHKGYLWLATWDGLNKFDGYTFTGYKAHPGDSLNLSHNRINTIVEDKYGFIWALCYDHTVRRFNPGNEQFERINFPRKSPLTITDIEALPGGNVWLLTSDNGAVRVVTDTKNHQMKPEFYSAKNKKLPTHKINKVYQDKAQNEWLLTNAGLLMIKRGSAVPIPILPSGEKQAFYCILEDKEEIYFGSDTGKVWRYKKKNGKTELIQLTAQSHIVDILPVYQDKVLFTTANDGFFIGNPNNDSLKHYHTGNCVGLINNNVFSSYVDEEHGIWFQLKGLGVTRFDVDKEEATYYPVKRDLHDPIKSQYKFAIHQDVDHRLWVHPYGGRFSYYDKEKKILIPFASASQEQKWEFVDRRHYTFSDKQGNLWLSSSRWLEKISFKKEQFHLLTPNATKQSLANEFRALFQDKDHTLWAGTRNGEVSIYDENQFIGKLSASGKIVGKDATDCELGKVYSIIQDRQGNIWMGTKGNGLLCAKPINKRQYQLTHCKHDPKDRYSLSNNNVYSVHEDPQGRIWVGTYGGGLNYLTKDKQGKTVFINKRNSLKDYPLEDCNNVRMITSDQNGKIWIGTTEGIVLFDRSFTKPEEIRFRHLLRIPGKESSLSNNDVHSIFITQKGEIFVATFGGGLNKVVYQDKENVFFKSYTIKDGIQSDILLSLQEDSKGNLWMASENGLTKFTPSTEAIDAYDERQIGFPALFSEGCALRTHDKSLYFGTNNGLLYFQPDSIRKSGYQPPIVFPQLLLHNRKVAPSSKTPTPKMNLDNMQKVVLTHKENIFTIQYAAIDLNNPDGVSYAYKLEGFEEEWRYVGKQRSATYTNLPKGNYVFKVKSTNGDGAWTNNVRALEIEVLPSFQETVWARLLYIIAVLLIIGSIVYICLLIYKLKNKVYVEQQISDLKLRFFTNISHELRTPLTLIAAPVEHLAHKKDIQEDVRQELLLVEKNTSRMLRLVNQLLDFRKIQNKKMKMQVRQIEIIAFITKVMDSFKALAYEYHITLKFIHEAETVKLWLDNDKFEKILFNLLSNAFKYTPHGRQIEVSVHQENEYTRISIQDEGPGIPKNRQNDIFLRFESSNNDNLFNSPSTGIGLSIVKEFVEMHGGNIHVESEPGQGSCFVMHFLSGRAHYSKNTEFILEDLDGDSSEFLKKEENIREIQQQEPEAQQPEDERLSILLVEDNEELRFFLHNIFGDEFQVLEAANGKEGLEKVRTTLPDMIISDVMMPEKDGMEFISELRGDMSTSHIPIVLLTAISTMESRIEAINSGADDYITKPFSAIYLKARINNLLTQRRKLQNFYSANLITVHAEDKIDSQETENYLTPNDHKFMNALIASLNKNMDNGELLVEDLMKDVNVSRSVFFRKLRSITGMSPIEFIRKMRVKRAAELIEQNQYSMAEVAYMVGFNDAHYFSKVFRQIYAMTPTEYKENFIAQTGSQNLTPGQSNAFPLDS